MNSRQLGRFWFDATMTTECPDGLATAFALLQLVPIRVEHLWHTRKFEVIGISDRFSAVADGEQVPDYEVSIIRKENETIAVVVNRVGCGSLS